MPLKFFQAFFKTSSIEGLLLLGVLFLTLLVANSPFYVLYQQCIHLKILGTTLSAFVNDGLMSFFFLLLALEIKRAFLSGETPTRQMLLPVLAACGGVLVPAIIYLAIVGSSSDLMRGWAIPVATDVALALGLLSLLGARVPTSLKLFLSVLAVADDLIAIVIIALFYTDTLSFLYLGLALASTLLLMGLNRWKVVSLIPYCIVSIVLWIALHHSGVHATLAGVVLGFCLPLRTATQTEHQLRPWIAYGLVPLFIAINAGVPFMSSENILSSALPWAIAMALFVGKQVGIFGFALLSIKMKWAHLPKGADWQQLYGVSVLAGIGFTMSLFVSNLAFDGTPFQMTSHVGILLGSLLSALVGMGFLIRK